MGESTSQPEKSKVEKEVKKAAAQRSRPGPYDCYFYEGDPQNDCDEIEMGQVLLPVVDFPDRQVQVKKWKT